MEEQPLAWRDDLEHLRRWSRDVFQFTGEALNVHPAEPLDTLVGKKIPYTDSFGVTREAMLFDETGRLTHNDLSFYTKDMFKNQTPEEFKAYNGTRFTWQQTVVLTAYNHALATFGRDAFNIADRWITVRSGHGVGKTATMSVIALHFILCFFGAQIGMTANTEQQVNDIFMKEFYVWKSRLPQFLSSLINQTDDHIRIEDEKDWFLRAQVARPERPEALAGLHGKYVLILVDEASGVSNKVFEVMKGALTGENYIVCYYSNPTRNEGEFYESHKPTTAYTKLHFTSRDSPIVKENFIEKMIADYGPDSDEVKIRVDGEFAGTAEMDEKGWMPLFANINIHFEPQSLQVINGSVIGVDPAGAGRDRSIVHVRDNIYLKEVLNEKTSSPIDLARKVETIRDAYNSVSSDIGIDGFGLGAEVIANVQTRMNDPVVALLTDKPRDETKHLYHTYNAELAWAFRKWLANGGIIITNNPKEWLREFDLVKWKRDAQGRIMIMSTVEFKKLYGFSPDRFKAACYTFFKDNPSKTVQLNKADREAAEARAFIQKATQQQKPGGYSSM